MGECVLLVMGNAMYQESQYGRPKHAGQSCAACKEQTSGLPLPCGHSFCENCCPSALLGEFECPVPACFFALHASGLVCLCCPKSQAQVALNWSYWTHAGPRLVRFAAWPPLCRGVAVGGRRDARIIYRLANEQWRAQGQVLESIPLKSSELR